MLLVVRAEGRKEEEAERIAEVGEVKRNSVVDIVAEGNQTKVQQELKTSVPQLWETQSSGEMVVLHLEAEELKVFLASC
jgi:hypothetical protein